MDLGLAGKMAVVTGGSKGIGLAVVRGLADSGAHVVTGARTSSAELRDLTGDGSVQAIEVDLADPAGPGRLAAVAGDRVDILVNNVGGAPARTGGFRRWCCSGLLSVSAARTSRPCSTSRSASAGRSSS